MAELLMGGRATTSDHLCLHPRPRLVDADGGLPPRSVTQTRDEVLADSERLIGTHHDPEQGAPARVALAPCSPFSVTSSLMTATAAPAERHDVRLHTHLAEDHDEDTYRLETYGCRRVEYFEETGWSSDRGWVAHCFCPDDAELRRLAAAGPGAAHCPSSDMLIGGGTARVRARCFTPGGLSTPVRCGPIPGPTRRDGDASWHAVRRCGRRGSRRPRRPSCRRRW